MKNFLIASVLFLVGVTLAQEPPPHYQLPTPDKSKYASAIIVEQCALVVAVIMVDDKGGLHPMHWSDFGTRQALDNAIFNSVPSHTTLEVAIDCQSEKST